jgi:hypothetical protein
MQKLSVRSKIKMAALSGALVVVVASACGRKEAEDSSVQWLASPGVSATEVDAALKAKLAVRLNLKTNRATLYKEGVAIQGWNIASADVTGIYHGGKAKVTPVGIYGIEDLEHCPVWRPVDPVNPATGKVAQSEAERWQVFNSRPDIYGPCGASNPLGKYVFWFHGPYGMHGNSAEEILQLRDPEERRVSGGCVRNPNAKIREIFHLALDTFSDELSSYKQSVLAMESQPPVARKTLTFGARNLNMRVVVGNWSSDPNVGSGSGLPPAPPVAQPEPTPVPIPEPVGPAMLCKAVVADPKSGVAPVHIRLPATPENISAFYRLNDPVRVLGLIPGTTFYKTSRGYIDKSYLGQCTNY